MSAIRLRIRCEEESMPGQAPQNGRRIGANSVHWRHWRVGPRYASKPEAFLRLEEPMQIALAIRRELEEKFSLMAAVGDVPDVIRREVTAGARHRLSA